MENPPVAVVRKRSRVGRLVKLALVLVVVAVVAVAALVFVAPSLLANQFVGFAERAFGDRFHGKVEVGHLELSWWSPQKIERVRLLDGSGAEIVSARLELPSLRALIAHEKLGKIRIELAGDLSADDAGRTNLEQALELRVAESHAAEPQPKPSAPATSAGAAVTSDWRDDARKVEVEVEIVADHLTWSDAHTRSANAPIRLEHLDATAKLAQGGSATLALASQLIAGAPRPIRIDAKVDHAFEAANSKTPPHADVEVAIDAFPTGFVDALTRVGGQLTQSLGESFDLHVHASGTTQSGDATVALKGPRATLALDARLADGILRGKNGRALSIALDPDPKWFDSLLKGALPAGTELTRGADHTLELAVDDLALPLAKVIDASAAGGDVVAALLDGAQAKVALRLGDWSYRDATLAAKSKTLALAGVHVAANLGFDAAGKGDAADPGFLDLQIGARSTAAAGEDEHIELKGDARELAQVAAGGPLGVRRADPSGSGAPGLALNVDLTAPMEVVAAFAGDTAPQLTPFGSTIHVQVATAASLIARPSAQNVPFGAADLARLDAKTSVTVECPGESNAFGFPWHPRLSATTDVAHGGAGHVAISFPGLRASKPDDRIHDGLVDVTSDHWTAASNDPLHSPLAFRIETGGIETTVVEHFIGTAAKLRERVGDWLALSLSGKGTMDALEATLDVESPHDQVKFAGSYKDRTLRATGDGLHVEAEVNPALIDSLLAGGLPEGTHIALKKDSERLILAVNPLTLPLAPLLDRKPGAPFDLSSQLAGVEVGVHATLGAWSYRDAQLDAAHTALDVSKLTLAVGVAAKSGAATAADVDLAGTLDADPNAPFDASAFHALVHCDDVVSLTKLTADRSFAPVHVEIKANGLRAALVDAWSGSGGAIAKQLGERFGVAVALDSSWKAGDAIALAGSVDLDAAPKPAHLAIDAKLADPFAARDHAQLPDVHAKLGVQGTDLVVALAPPPWRAIVADALGSAITLEVSNATRAKPAGQDVTLKLDAPGVKLEFGGSIEEQVLRMSATQRAALTVPIKAALLDLLVGARMPKGEKLALAKEGEPLALVVTGLELPLGAWLAPQVPSAAITPPPALPALDVELERARAHLSLELPSLVYTQAAAKAGDAATTVTLSNLKVAPVEFEPGKLVTAEITASVSATPPGSIDLKIDGDHPFAFLADQASTLKPKLRLKGKLTGIPTALVDALAAQDGLVVEVAGPTLALDVSGAWPTAPGEALQATLDSPKANVQLHAESKEMLLISSGDQGLDAKLGITPLFGKRVVGNLVPMVVDVKQADGSPPATMTWRKFQLPLSGDLRQLDGDVALDLGTLSFRLLPGLADAFSSAKGGNGSTKIDPIAIQIRNGVATYDSLALPIGGRKLVFKGTFDLVDKKMKMQTKVPLKWMGKSALSALGKGAALLGPDTEVPIDIGGTSSDPKFSIDKAFVEEALKKAAENALGGLFGKKKG